MCHHGQPPPPPPSTWCLITSAFPSPLSVHPGSFIVPPTHILLFHLNTSNMCFHLHPVFVHASFHLSIYPSLGHLYTSPPPAVSLPATISPDTTSPQDLSMLTPGQIKLGFWEFHPSFVFPGNTQAPFSHEYSDYCAHPPPNTYTPHPFSFGTAVIPRHAPASHRIILETKGVLCLHPAPPSSLCLAA